MARYVINLVRRGSLNIWCESDCGVATQEMTFLIITHEVKVI